MEELKEYEYDRRRQDEYLKKLEEKIDDLNKKIDGILYKVNILWAVLLFILTPIGYFLVNKIIKLLSITK